MPVERDQVRTGDVLTAASCCGVFTRVDDRR